MKPRKQLKPRKIPTFFECEGCGGTYPSMTKFNKHSCEEVRARNEPRVPTIGTIDSRTGDVAIDPEWRDAWRKLASEPATEGSVQP